MDDLSAYPEYIQEFIKTLKVELDKSSITLMTWEIISDTETVTGNVLALKANAEGTDVFLKRWIPIFELSSVKASPELFAKWEAEDCRESFAEHFRYERQKQKHAEAVVKAYVDMVPGYYETVDDSIKGEQNGAKK